MQSFARRGFQYPGFIGSWQPCKQKKVLGLFGQTRRLICSAGISIGSAVRTSPLLFAQSMSVLARNNHTSSLHKQQPSPSYDSAYRSAMSDSEGSYSSDFSGSEYDSRSDRSRSPSRSRSRGRRNTRSRSRSFSPSRSRSPAPRATKARGRPTKKPVAPKRSLLKPGAKRRRPGKWSHHIAASLADSRIRGVWEDASQLCTAALQRITS